MLPSRWAEIFSAFPRTRSLSSTKITSSNIFDYGETQCFEFRFPEDLRRVRQIPGQHVPRSNEGALYIRSTTEESIARAVSHNCQQIANFAYAKLLTNPIGETRFVFLPTLRLLDPRPRFLRQIRTRGFSQKGDVLSANTIQIKQSAAAALARLQAIANLLVLALLLVAGALILTGLTSLASSIFAFIQNVFADIGQSILGAYGGV